MQVGQRIDEMGVLLREGEAFYLRRSLGGRFKLDLRRAPSADVGRQVRIFGTFVGNELIDVNAVSAADDQ
jgi:hypothetical protein